MELFSEIYNLYYRAVENVLRQAQKKPLGGNEVQRILSEGAFSESALAIFPKLKSGSWPLLSQSENGYTAICAPLKINPLTTLQKAWIKALLNDPRIHLFFDKIDIKQLQEKFSDIEPLYNQADFHLFDKADDGNNYDKPEYQKNFRLFLSAIREKTALSVQYEGGKGKRVTGVFKPYRLEYSQKDDKFRAYCYKTTGGRSFIYTLNIGRITAAEPVNGAVSEATKSVYLPSKNRYRQVIIEITKERNALERCMMHFAHFEKRTEYDEATEKYTCAIRYNVMDESEVIIRVLSFGPTVRVLEPAEFVDEIRQRVKRQSDLIKLSKMHNDINT